MTINPIYLITIFTVFILATTTHILVKRGILYAGVYFFIFIYTIFAQIGYVYYPILSVSINAYFGIETFYPYFYFVFFSFLGLYLLIIVFAGKFPKWSLLKVCYQPSIYNKYLLIFLVVFLQSAILTYFLLNYDSLIYESIALDEHRLFSFLYKNLTILNVTLYIVTRNRIKKQLFQKSFLPAVLTSLGLSLSVIIAIKIGNRTDLLALFLGIITFEFLTIEKKTLLKKLVVFSVIGVLFVLGLLKIEAKRSDSSVSENLTSIEHILFKDYYAPSHILFAAIDNKYIRPDVVLLSNLSNSFVMTGYPYLQNFIERDISKAETTRSASYAFFIFSEGYMAFGNFGVLYNAIIIFLGISLWKSLASTKDKRFNTFMIALFATQFANIARCQSCYFIKDLYMIFPIGIIAFYLATGIRPKIMLNSLSK